MLRTGRPAQYEFTREDEFTIAPLRHPMRVAVTLGATADGVLTAMAVDVLLDTGAYGNHGLGVMFHGSHESLAVYRTPNRRVDAEAVYTNNPPSGAFRGYGLGQVMFAVESAMDELARQVGIGPFELRRRNAIVPGDPIVVTDADEETDLQYGGYGLAGGARPRGDRRSPEPGEPAPTGPQWRVGTGHGARHDRDDAAARALQRGRGSRSMPDGGVSLDVGTAEFGNGTTTVHAQIVAEVLAIPPDRVRIRSSDTDGARYDTGAFGSAGTVVAGKAVHVAALRAAGSRARRRGTRVEHRAGRRPHARGPPMPLGDLAPLEATGSADGTPRGLAFNVHGFRVAVDTGTGEVRILQVGAGRRRRHRAEPGAAARPGRGRHGAGDRLRALRGGAGRRRARDSRGRSGTTTCRSWRTCRSPRCGSRPPTTTSARSARSR